MKNQEKLLTAKGSDLEYAIKKATEAELRLTLETGKLDSARRARIEDGWRKVMGMRPKDRTKDADGLPRPKKEVEEHNRRVKVLSKDAKKGSKATKVMPAKPDVLVRDELTKAAKVSVKKGEKDRVFRHRLAVEADKKMTDARFERLSDKAQRWLNAAMRAHNADKTMPKFPDEKE